MTVIYAILFGMIQGIAEFFPVSSFGHLSALEKIFGISRTAGVLFESMLHVGTIFAVFLVFQRDIRRLTEEYVGMAGDLLGNLNLYIHNRKTGEDLKYARIISNSYRKFAVLVLISTIPTTLLGYVCRRLIVMAAVSPMLPGIGILITGIVLLVTDIGGAGGNRSAREAAYANAMWIGICQGLSVFPGLSRCGLTICAALLCGFSKTFAVKYSYIISIPAVIGAFLAEIGEFASPSMSLGLGAEYVVGMLVAALTSYLFARTLLRILTQMKFRIFAYYCFAAGILILACNYLL